MYSQKQGQSQNQKQQQKQKMSMQQIQAVNFLAMGTQDLRDEIYKFAAENPALEIVSDAISVSETRGSRKFDKESYSTSSYGGSEKADAFQNILENTEERRETLQQHLMHQLNSMNVSGDEYELSQKLIYNLDKNGCYGSMLNPETLLDVTRPAQTKKMLARCIERIQRMDPVGVCCKNPEESLYVQAKIEGNASVLTLFILDGRLELLNPPEPSSILKKVSAYKKEWHKKAFATALSIDSITLTEEVAAESLDYILHLNPRPAQDYVSDVTSEFEKPDIVLSVEKKAGRGVSDDFSRGIVACDEKSYFQLRYASGSLPEIRISEDFFDKTSVEQARMFVKNLEFRESTVVLQGCAIVKAQKDFFIKGPGNLKPLTRNHIAQTLGIHPSTVSRMANKKNSKFLDTEWGLYPVSYFFTSGVKSDSEKEGEISSERIKTEINYILENPVEFGFEDGLKISDNKLSILLNERGIKIARRTVTKYRNQLGLRNSYKR